MEENEALRASYAFCKANRPSTKVVRKAASWTTTGIETTPEAACTPERGRLLGFFVVHDNLLMMPSECDWGCQLRAGNLNQSE